MGAGIFQIVYTLRKGFLFNPWSSARLDKTSHRYWLGLAGAISALPLGAFLMWLATQ
jgi:hypothetical protein